MVEQLSSATFAAKSNAITKTNLSEKDNSSPESTIVFEYLQLLGELEGSTAPAKAEEETY